jgi:hypothetical protein
MKNRLFRVTALGCLATGLLTTAATASTIYSTGFESPTFTEGNIDGQDGWKVVNPDNPPFYYQVETFNVKSGSQAVIVRPQHSGLQTGVYHSDTAAGPIIDLAADLYLTGGNTWWQFAGLGPGLFPFIGGIDIDLNANNQMTLITAGSPNAGTFTRDTWHHVDFLFNMITQQYNFSFDGSLVATGVPFCGSNAGCTGAPVSSYGSSLFDVFTQGDDIGYIDNFSLSNVSVGVPEPASFFLIAVGVALVVTKRHMAPRTAGLEDRMRVSPPIPRHVG